MISKLTHAYQLKKQKIEAGSSTLTLNNHELKINPETMIFLNMSPQKVE